jgi:hypothetical protein
MVFRYKSDVNSLRMWLPFFEPEKMAFANTKTFQVRVSVFAFVVCKGCDPKWLQSLGIESNGTLKVTDCENNVIYHIFLSVLVGIDLNGSMVVPFSSEPYATVDVSVNAHRLIHTVTCRWTGVSFLV